jgi:high affinity sulfate transporter 1
VTTALLVVAIAIPLSMGMAEVAGVAPVAGLYTCVLPLIAYACIGASRHLVIGLDASTAAMLAAAVSPLAAGDEARYVALAGGLTLLVGVALLIGGGLRLGIITSLLSNPALLGYQAGLGVIVIVNQLHRLLGVPVTESDSVPRAVEIIRELDATSLWTLGVAVLTAAVIVVTRLLKPAAPGALIGVVVATVAVAIGDLADQGVALVGVVPSGLPHLSLPGLQQGDVTALATAAVAIAIVAAADTMATARAFAVRNGYEIDANRELLALGTANVASGVSGGITASASAARTAVAEDVGGHTPLASALAGALLAVVLLLFTPVLEAVPVAALGAVVVLAVARIIDIPALARLARISTGEVTIALITMATVIVGGTLEGLVVAVLLSLGRVAVRFAIARLRPGSAPLDVPDAAMQVSGPLFFANAERFARHVIARAELDQSTEVVVDASRVTDVDVTAAAALTALDARLESRDRSLRLVGASPAVTSQLHRYGLDRLVAERRRTEPAPG